MLLYNICFVENIKKNIIYSETNKLFVSSEINNGLISINNNIILLLSNNVYYLYNTINNSNSIYFYNYVRQQLKNSLFGSSFRFRMIGRGYYLYSKKNILYFRLGFSHVIKYVLPLNSHLSRKKKKKIFWVLYGIDLNILIKIAYAIRGMRGPNLYSKRIKGISLHNEFIPRGINSFSKF